MRFGAPFLDKQNASQLWRQSYSSKVPLYVLLRRKPKPMAVVIYSKAKKRSEIGLPSRLLVQECLLGSVSPPRDSRGRWEMPHGLEVNTPLYIAVFSQVCQLFLTGLGLITNCINREAFWGSYQTCRSWMIGMCHLQCHPVLGWKFRLTFSKAMVKLKCKIK